MISNSNNLFSKNKDLYNTRIIDYKDSQPEFGLDVIAKEALETNDIVKFFERIDTYAGLFSTQQLFNLDWSKFENHTFFDSAIAKVNYVFDVILNDFPYDATFFDYSQFVKKLDGYSYYILKEKFPKTYNSIYLGSFNERLDDSYIEVIDQPGFVLKEKTENKGFLNPKNKTFCFDFWISINNNEQRNGRIITQKIDTANNVGFTLYVNNANEKTLNLLITNHLGESVKSSIDISKFISTEKYDFNTNPRLGFFHVSVISTFTNNSDSKKDFKFFVNGVKVKETTIGAVTSDFFEINNNNFNNASLFIGNGDHHDGMPAVLGELDNKSLNGLIDEFRFFHKDRSEEKIIKEKDETIFAQDGLVLYLKFNEPQGEYRNNFLTLDSSGNKLHGQIKNDFNLSILSESEVSRLKSYGPAPILRETRFLFPVIFPNFLETKTLQTNLLEIADEYDSVNPNLIFNMFPKHYFIEGSDFEGISNIFANNTNFSEKNTLGIDQPATQEFVNILLIWARFFDEIKCYIDNVSEVINTSYEDLNNKSPFGVIMPIATKLLGFDFKNIFPSPSRDSLDGFNFSYNDVQNELGIRKIQNEIWKRILINSQDFLRSKGTVNSIKSIFNAAGIEADKFIDIKEFNGKNKLNFSETNRIFAQSFKFIDFGENSLLFKENTLTGNIPDYKLRLESGELHKHDTQDNYLINDFTYEGYYRFKNIKKNILNLNQSLVILSVKDVSGGDHFLPFVNLTFNRTTQDKEFGTLRLEIRASSRSDFLHYQKIEIENIDLINSEMWHISFGRKYLGDESDGSPIWENFLYARQAGNKKYISKFLEIKEQKIKKFDVTSAVNFFLVDKPKKISIGLDHFAGAVPHLRNPTTVFEGEVSNIRFYDTYLTQEDLSKRSNDITYVGFKNPLDKKYLILNYDLTEEILDSSIVDVTNGGIKININDKSDFHIGIKAGHRLNSDEELNSKVARNKGALVTRNTRENLLSCIKRGNLNVLKNDIRFDEVFSSEKIKINAFNSEDLAKLNNGIIAPNSVLNPDMTQFNELRLSIEHSNVKYLNQDISKMIGSFEFLSKAYGLSSNIYDINYVDIKLARKSYFEKLTREIDYKPMQQFFKYFDNILSSLIEESIPSKVNYMGFNYVYESHSLERHKYEYKMSESRLPIEDSGFNFSTPKLNSPRTEDYIKNRTN